MIPDTLYYDRAGNPIGLEEWASLREDPTYCRVEQTVIKCQDTERAVLTVWKGVDSTLSGAILSTAIFADGHLTEVWDYETETDALDGHYDIVWHLVYDLRPYARTIIDGVDERWDEFVRAGPFVPRSTDVDAFVDNPARCRCPVHTRRPPRSKE